MLAFCSHSTCPCIVTYQKATIKSYNNKYERLCISMREPVKLRTGILTNIIDINQSHVTVKFFIKNITAVGRQQEIMWEVQDRVSKESHIKIIK